MNSVISPVSRYLSMIKFSHSVFALPFAFTGALLASNGIPDFEKLLWIVVAMVGARTAAMGFNRIIDRKIDSLNPRTKNREIPTGVVSIRSALILSITALLVLFFAAYKLNPLCLMLSPIAVFVFIGYSYTKRFTWMSHFVLGMALSAAPLGAWIGIKGTFDPEIIPLGIAVVFWLAGFDTLYALQDLVFDKIEGLHSIPARFGEKLSLVLARIFHAVAWLMFLLNGILFDLNCIYWIGLVIVGVMLAYEHSLIKHNDLSRLDMAFFNMNGYISITVFFFTLLAILLS
ncbi:MAG: UbiA-like polyprenyltransferase [Dissulfurispiraceae bacterium]|jgi:4-hydroxybenzoate polyprenyltransferase|nr:UbiA-like polyprenyltransferase [Dissulfurispiraceae bacterium]